MRDLRDAFRALRATPMASTVAVLSLALGIGANTAVFSILNSLMLRPLPVRDPATLVAFADRDSGERLSLDYPVWLAIRDRGLLDAAFAWAGDSLTETRDGQTVPVRVMWGSGHLFDSLGITAALGRTFAASDDRRGGGPDGPVAVISVGFWKRRYGGASDVVGKVLVLDRAPFTIVGVAQANFIGLDVGTPVDVVLPLETEPLLGRLPSRLQLWPWLHVMGRVARGGSLDAVTAKVFAEQAGIRRATMPDFTNAEDRDAYLKAPWAVRPAGVGASRLRTRYATALAILAAIAALVLVVACVNIANLQVARAVARRYELSVRAALGASPWRVMRPVLLENVVLAVAGTAAGLFFARWAAPFLVRQLATWAATPDLDLSIDARVLAVTTISMTAAVLIFGTSPAWLARRADPIDVLKRDAVGHGPSRSRFRDGLVALQVAICVVLVFAAHLFVRSFAALTLRDLGFDRRPVVVAVVDATRSRVAAASRLELYERLRARAAAVPGVEHAALSLSTPLGSAGVRITPKVSLSAGGLGEESALRVLAHLVTPGWFATYGTRIVAGRDFTPGDRAGSDAVAIVNEAFAARFFATANPVGQTFATRGAMSPGTDVVTVIGVVDNAAFTSVRAPIEPEFYRPIGQGASARLFAEDPSISVSVRARTGIVPASLHEAVAQAIVDVDRNLAVMPIDVQTQLDAYYVRERLLGLVSGFFGLLGLALAAIGLYGVTAQAVTGRRREIGIRLALGADRRRVVRLMLRRYMLVATLGAGIGVLVSVWAGPVVDGLLYGVNGHDPVALVTSAAALVLASLVAALLPAQRAGRTDPMIVLRDA